jgi:hypothetical protein
METLTRPPFNEPPKSGHSALKEPATDEIANRAANPWNEGKLIGQKAPFKLKEIWAIRVRLQIYSQTWELA